MCHLLGERTATDKKPDDHLCDGGWKIRRERVRCRYPLCRFHTAPGHQRSGKEDWAPVESAGILSDRRVQSGPDIGQGNFRGRSVQESKGHSGERGGRLKRRGHGCVLPVAEWSSTEERGSCRGG